MNSSVGYAGVAVTVVCAAISLWLGIRHRPARTSVAAALGLLAGLGDAAFWGSRVTAMNPAWWIVAGVLGAALGVVPALVGQRLQRRVGVQIGDYDVQGVIGSGASSAVYRAVDQTGQPVAIKVLSPAWFADPEFRDRFRDEAPLMRSLDHPNCVRVRDVLDDGRIAAIVFDYVDGASLRAVLQRAGHLEPGQAAAVLDGALAGLAHVHERGLVHRDVKPENILVDRSGTSRLVDYGLARNIGQFAAGSEASVGSPRYMSPEQVSGSALDARADIYSCGAVLFELLTGQPPYSEDSLQALMQAHVSAPVPDPRAVRPDVPEALAVLAMQALAKRPADRPSSTTEFRDRLAAAVSSAVGQNWTPAAAAGGLAALSAAAAAAAGTALSGGAHAATASLAGLTGETTVSGTVASGTVNPPPSSPSSSPSSAPSTTSPSAQPHTGGQPATSSTHSTNTPHASSPTHSTRDTHAEPPAGVPPRKLINVVRRKPPIMARGPVVTTVVVVVSVVPIVVATTAHPTMSLASCIVGTWQAAGGQYDDEWDGAPVRVHYPASPLNGITRYNSDGTWESVAPAGEPPRVGTLNGAPFIDTTYGTSSGRWKAEGNHEVVYSDDGASHSVTILYAGYEHVSSTGTALQTGTYPVSVSCNRTTLKSFDRFVYKGRKLISTNVARRISGSAALPTSAPVPDQSKLLGGVDLDRYCGSQGFSRADTTKPLTGPGAANDNWTCTGATSGSSTTSANGQSIDMNAACQWWWTGYADVVARAVDPNSAGSWLCYGGPARTFTISPDKGGFGTIVTLTAQTPCPADAQGLAVSVEGSGPLAVFQGGTGKALPGGGSWSVQWPMVNPSPGTHLPAGQVRFFVSCILPGGKTQAYKPMVFQFTGS